MPRRTAAKSGIFTRTAKPELSAYEKVVGLLRERLRKKPERCERNLKTRTLLILVTAKIFKELSQHNQHSSIANLEQMQKYIKKHLFPEGIKTPNVDDYFQLKRVKQSFEKMLRGDYGALVSSHVFNSLLDRTGMLLKYWRSQEGFAVEWVGNSPLARRASMVSVIDSDGETEEEKRASRPVSPCLHLEELNALYLTCSTYGIFDRALKHVRQRLLDNNHVNRNKHCDKTSVLLVILLTIMRDEWRKNKKLLYANLHL